MRWMAWRIASANSAAARGPGRRDVRTGRPTSTRTLRASGGAITATGSTGTPVSSAAARYGTGAEAHWLVYLFAVLFAARYAWLAR